MGILIDPPRWPAHDTVFAHLISDTSLEELHAFAREAELPPRAFDHDHYDVPASRYDDLVALGAHPVGEMELIRALTASGLRVRKPQKSPTREQALDVAHRSWRGLGLPNSLRDDLLTRWQDPHRHYHDVRHLAQVLTALEELQCTDPVVVLAAWFHDAVYEGVASEDEEASARLAEESLSRLSGPPPPSPTLVPSQPAGVPGGESPEDTPTTVIPPARGHSQPAADSARPSEPDQTQALPRKTGTFPPTQKPHSEIQLPPQPAEPSQPADLTADPEQPVEDTAENRPSRLPYVIGALVLIGIIGTIVFFLLTGGDDDTAVPAPVPTETTTASVEPTPAAPPAEVTIEPAPADPAPTEEPPVAPAPTEPAAPETTVAVEPTEPVASEPVTDPATETAPAAETEPADQGAQPQPLTAAALPETLLGYTLTTSDGTLAYRQGDQTILLLDLGITTVDPGWQDMLFPDPTVLNDKVLCSTDANGAENCLIKDTPFGVITVGDGVSSGIGDLAVAIADHLG
ncbi:DUF4031 domain-containing protein [Tessaracoccus massiliensis]|uniref:DUF4031 domain-containing protein n=1 Tax=Tessaracoccus massiliensis TaxID=1522311 RepID=UPI000693EC1F|nr:DUF4031 domain-containing protein [Tessaracoccus massiliensis]